MKAIYITDKDLKDWLFGRRILSLKQHFSDHGSTLKRIQIDCEDTTWIYEPKNDKVKLIRVSS